jgi:hypothetical protein
MENITIERLREREHQLHAYCHHCDRWRVLDLADMLSRWQGLVLAPTEVPCADCGELGLLRIRRRPPLFADRGRGDDSILSLAG